ncbi:phenylacetate--CoA ligase family protein [Carboxydothermus ferrireducens]|uniref:Phenylacetate-coenzyme A ligase n=1 Tax=Carboxydothermus ferrireducens DSM 11255 TaxID=1119529 RepID=A0ABX2R694_9THEO|nr:phenylacetate--CoA ligase [Carboxydothermus ferrireducens]NYE56595.1 phenylacetate-CoA ligase [Carboxydothermus ferrireducens DSM 11255]
MFRNREEIKEIQLHRLKELVKRVYERVPFYRQKLDAIGFTPDKLKSLEDLRHLPFTTKQDLRDNYPFGLFAVSQEEIVRIHASSGTTGKPTVVGYTKNDIDLWSELMARSMRNAGVTSRDIIHNAYGYGLFTGGLGFHYGAEKLGATVVPVSGGNSKRQLMLMEDFGATVLTCTPSYALHLAEEMEEQGISRDRLKLRLGIFGAEPWSEELRAKIEEKLKIKAIDVYGLSEILGPGVAMECQEQKGLHINEDHFLPEIIDPDTGEVLPYGEKGELVITTLTKEGIPLLRYRTRDITALYPEPCACGNGLIRMDRVTGRSDDMLIIRGVNVFPSQIETVLLSLGYTEPHYMIVVDKKGALDQLEVWVELSEQFFSDEIKKLEQWEKKVEGELFTVLGINAKVRLVEPRSIPRSEGKAKRIWDRRELK